MAAKKRSKLHPGIRQQLEDALLEALHRHVGSRTKVSAKKKKAPVRKKKAGKKKTGKKRPVRRKKRA